MTPVSAVQGLVEKLKTQKGIIIEQKVIPGANHFFEGKIDELIATVGTYLDKRIKAKAAGERA